jgi:glutamate---cysteine ligase / carboxylate-amine ligase
VLTVGVEEEFLLLDADGAVAPAAPDVVRAVEADGQVHPELMAYQIETATRACTGLDELRSELVRLRLLVAEGAQREGLHLVAAGAPPYRSAAVAEVTPDPRYQAIARRFPTAAAIAGGDCACQVHVGVPDREVGVRVLARLRPWLPVLLALTANSAVVNGGDTGWRSYRYRMQMHWPTFRPPGVWTSADRYDRTMRSLVDSGAAVDEAGVYLLARLSSRYPTVEVRVGDACLTTDDALLFAAVVRALVATIMLDLRIGWHDEPLRGRPLDSGLLTVARRGVDGLRVHPGSSLALPHRLSLLLEKVTPALIALGDVDEVRRGFERIVRSGTGADRQRALLSRATSRRAFVAALADAAIPALSGSS